MAENENFLERWSRRKRDGDDKQALQEEETPQEQQAALPQDQAVDPDSAPQQPADVSPEGAEGPKEPEPWEGVDIETLNADSDYTVFMAEGVPDNVKKEALDKLWRSDPVFANLDGLNDYDDDYSKWGIVSQVVKTAYKIGQGYLTDDEVVELQAARDEEDRVAAQARGDEIPTEDPQSEDPQSEDGKPEEAQPDMVAEGEGEQSSESDGRDEQPLEHAEADSTKPEIIDDEPDEVV